jgi:hypothetical protein
VPGVTWSEVACGTNAIGTALAAQRPAQIHAAEHFCAGIQGWTCSAAVVRHPLDGELLGTLDVSGLSGTYHRQSLAFVINTASRIEARLAMVEMERRYRLLDHALGRWSADGQDAMVLFDRRGCPIKASAHAQRAIEALGGGLDLTGQQRVPACGPAAGGVACCPRGCRPGCAANGWSRWWCAASNWARCWCCRAARWRPRRPRREAAPVAEVTTLVPRVAAGFDRC